MPRGPAGARRRHGPGNARGLPALLKLALPRFAQRTRLALLIEGRILWRLLEEGRMEPHEAWARVILGLISMQERVRALNGELAIDSKPGSGTVTVSVPLSEDREQCAAQS